MSKFHCPCGWTISNVAFPCSEESHVISDDDLDALTDYLTHRIDRDGFNARQRNILECSQCGRLHLQKMPRVNDYATYAKEVDADAHIVQLEAALAGLLYSDPTDPWHDEATATAEQLLKRTE